MNSTETQLKYINTMERRHYGYGFIFSFNKSVVAATDFEHTAYWLIIVFSTIHSRFCRQIYHFLWKEITSNCILHIRSTDFQRQNARWLAASSAVYVIMIEFYLILLRFVVLYIKASIKWCQFTLLSRFQIKSHIVLYI